MSLTIKTKGDFKDTEKLLKKSLGKDYMSILHDYGRKGVMALQEATPKDTGETAASWRYEITQNGSTISITWHNDHIEDGANIALLIQYGHATSNGYFIRGRDYINPALKPIFDDLANKAWREVTRV